MRVLVVVMCLSGSVGLIGRVVYSTDGARHPVGEDMPKAGLVSIDGLSSLARLHRRSLWRL